MEEGHPHRELTDLVLCSVQSIAQLPETGGEESAGCLRPAATQTQSTRQRAGSGREGRGRREGERGEGRGGEQDQAGRGEGESRIRQGGERGESRIRQGGERGRVEADLCGAAVKTALIKASSQLVVSRSVRCEIAHTPSHAYSSD